MSFIHFYDVFFVADIIINMQLFTEKNVLEREPDLYSINNRRYIGNKTSLNDWIFNLINEHCDGDSFADIFAGTSAVSADTTKYFKKIIINDFLYSNYVTAYGFLKNSRFNSEKIYKYIDFLNQFNYESVQENYFSENYGDKYFSRITAKKIGNIRERLEKDKNKFNKKEWFILLSSLIYSSDKIANTVGHYDAYFKKNKIVDNFILKGIKPIKSSSEISIFREDANKLVQGIRSDVFYIDPPYNSRQYSRFYHLLENLTQWKKPKLYGVALKPEPKPENTSRYCKVDAVNAFQDLIEKIQGKFIVVSYNNTYESKSSSSKNKITLEQIEKILMKKGSTKVFNKKYRHFNSGKTSLLNHKEYLFITKIKHE